jgi:hypothetical protein
MKPSRLWCLLLGAVWMMPTRAISQVGTDDQRLALFGSLGVTRFLADFAEGQEKGYGVAARIGLQLPGEFAALSLSRWPNVKEFRITSLQLELARDLVVQRAITPYLVVGVGNTWGAFLGTGQAVEPTGTSASFGFGVKAAILPQFVIAAQTRLRTDDAGWNGDWELMAEARRGRVLARPSSRRINLTASWMSPIAGPWRTVKPGWGLQISQNASAFSVQMVHWQIPRDAPLGGYLWDTNAVIASILPRIWSVGDVVVLRIGPAIAAMGEGPDNGVTLGSAGEIVLGAPVGPMRLETAVGWLFLNREGDGPDQHGVTLSLAVGR